VETSDGGFVVVSTMNVSSTTLAARVFKVDKTGGLVWQEAFTGVGNATAISVDLTSDGGIVVAGSTGLGVVTQGLLTTALVLKLDSTGVLMWEKTYSGLGGSLATSIRQTSDEGLVVAGATTSIFLGSEAWVLRLTSSGSVVWQNAYTGEGSLLFSAQPTSDGGFIAAGTTAAGALVLRLDSTGAPIWQKSYGGVGQTALAFSTEQTSDGGFIVAGTTVSTTVPSAFVFRLDGTGSLDWQRTFSPASLATSVQQTSDGGFVVAGVSFSTMPDALVFKLNSHGAIHPCKDLSKSNLVASVLSTAPTSITGSAVDIASPATITTTFTSAETVASTMLLCHHGFKP
jgi:hypothetical protein